MGKMLLRGLHMTIDSRSYIDAMHAVLVYAGWTSYSKAVLSGMTVTGFRFVVNRRLTSESATAYNWMAENFLAADFVGVTASQSAGFSFHPTFPLYQNQALFDVKASIDRGIGAVFWKERFVIATGYDDEEEMLYYDDGEGLGAQPMPYGEFGINRSPYWYYQVFEGRIKLDPVEVYKESLVQAVYKWETHDIMLPETEYACGSEAYEAIKQALINDDFEPLQAYEIFRCYAAAKGDISEYMDILHSFWPELGAAAEAYHEAAISFQSAAENMTGHGCLTELTDELRIQSLVHLFDGAQRAEQRAIDHIKMFMQERIGNRFDNIGLR